MSNLSSTDAEADDKSKDLKQETEEEGAAIDDDCNKQSTNDEPKHNGAQVSRSTRYQCKPDFSCWNFLPSPIHEKWTKLKNWFWGDMMKTHLIWIKLIFFFQTGSLVVLYPYLVIHMRSLGLSVEEVAFVNGVIPVADIVGPPMAGFVADKIGNFRVFMSLLTAISGAASLLLLFIPPKIDKFSGGSGGIILTCCSPSLCQDSNSTIFSSVHNSTSNDTVALCNLHDDHTFGVVQEETPGNQSLLNTDGCDTVHCTLTESWIQEHGYSARSDWNQILIYYTVLRCLIDVLRASSIMMFEGAVVVTIKQLGGDYGLQKLFGTFGAIIWGPVSGQIIDMASSATGTENYEPIFYTFFIMRLISAALILKLNLSFKKPAKKVFKNLGKLIIKPHILMFLIVFFVCGSIWGFLEAYLFWFLEDLGSTKLTMGISLAIGTIAGIPLTISSGAIIKKFGNCNVIVLALALYSLRLLGYSFIDSPLESLFFEVLKPFGNSLLLIAAMTYAKNNADIETMASLEGVMGALYFGIGKAAGSLIGGLVIEDIGVRNTFRCFSVVSLVTASVYFAFTYALEKRKTEPKADPELNIATVTITRTTEKVAKKDSEITDNVKIKEIQEDETRCT